MHWLMTSVRRSILLRGAQLFAFWTVFVVLFAFQYYAYAAQHGHPGPLFQYLRWSMEGWYTWGAISTFILWLAAKYPFEPRRAWRSLSVHLLVSVLIAIVVVGIQAVLSHWFEPDTPSIRERIASVLSKDVAGNIFMYWALTGLAQMLYFYRENNTRQLRETQLQQQLAQAQLQVLHMQLHPHFLFNTLHTIGTLIQEDPVAAEEMLLNLSGLLRVFLEQESAQQIPLRRELHLVDLYLRIQQIRFKDRLTIRSVIDPDTINACLPSLILQPLVENAILHGVAKNPGNDVIEIKSSHQGGRLVIEISNFNSSLEYAEACGSAGWGIGLSNTQQRLEQIYNRSATLSLQPRSPHGVVCTIAVPMERALSVPLADAEELLSL